MRLHHPSSIRFVHSRLCRTRLHTYTCPHLRLCRAPQRPHRRLCRAPLASVVDLHQRLCPTSHVPCRTQHVSVVTYVYTPTSPPIVPTYLCPQLRLSPPTPVSSPQRPRHRLCRTPQRPPPPSLPTPLVTILTSQPHLTTPHQLTTSHIARHQSCMRTHHPSCIRLASVLHPSASVSRLHVSACVCIRLHLSASVLHVSVSVCIRLHPSCIRLASVLHLSASVCICLHPSASVCMCLHVSASVCICLQSASHGVLSSLFLILNGTPLPPFSRSMWQELL